MHSVLALDYRWHKGVNEVAEDEEKMARANYELVSLFLLLMSAIVILVDLFLGHGCNA